MRLQLIIPLAAAASQACASAGYLAAAPRSPDTSAACATQISAEPLVACAPLILQATHDGSVASLDRPAALDADGSGTLRDDFARISEQTARDPVPLYSSSKADATHHYLFYGLYYATDWSGSARMPHIDHVGDFEGLLVVVARDSGKVEAVVTQAHRLFYLWTPVCAPGDRACSGRLSLTPDGRPVVFAEYGGHGLYAFGTGRFHPPGGTRYQQGPSAVPDAHLLAITTVGCGATASPPECVPAQIVPLDRIRSYTISDRGGFKGLSRRAPLPPWQWTDRRGRDDGRVGAIVLDPAALYAALSSAQRP